MAEETTAMVQEVKQEVEEPMSADAAKKAKRKATKAPSPSPEPSSESSANMSSSPNKNILLFNKYGYDGLEVRDLSLRNYVNLKPLIYPVTYRRTSKKDFSKATINIIERLANDMMRGGTGGKVGGKVIRTKGRLQGKKLTTLRIIEDAFEIISRQTKENPIQVYIKALENAAPIEDTTRVRYGGIISNIPVDVSASRRLDIAVRNLAM
ncbi:MAG: hypothetical protein M1504_04220, partial [Candidatus Marsarchaeota archaeon]|nr:hypothetical protein [Candidatus Marsarchaeota archaeon]